jgi:nucleotide-binding universal stress UspA family protein
MAAGVGPVVAGTDFSETAGVALTEARRLSSLLGVRLEVVHVVDGAPAGGASRAAADAWLRSMGVAPDALVVRYGRPWVELARYAAEVLPTLVVVGSHGESGYQPLTIGSTAARLSMQAGCPVVLVSPRVRGVKQDRELTSAGRVGAAAGARGEPGGQ